jgi:hypothetical protein
MHQLSLLSQIVLYVLLAFMGVISIIVWLWQIKVMQGKAMKNADGSADDWHEQKILYGVAVADVFLACPATIVSIVLVFVYPRWGYYILALVSFWFLWANVMTTATSLRFQKPKITFYWFIVFPFGSILGLAYILWTFIHFDIIYFQ